MRGAWSVGRLFGIDVRIHFTFVLLRAAGAVVHALQGGARSAVEGLAFVLLLFGSVLLHELGHARMARRFGIPTRDITLLPIGGVARMELPARPRAELAIALAGPAVNVAIAVVLGVALAATSGLVPVSQVGLATGPFVERLMLANLSLALFNLLPAFPMDGGRVLRSVLASWQGQARATRMAAKVGKAMALLLGVAGLFGNPMLVLVAVFVWFAGEQEAQAVELQESRRLASRWEDSWWETTTMSTQPRAWRPVLVRVTVRRLPE